MPLTALRRAEPVLEHLVRSLKPNRIISECARGDRAAYYRNFKGYRMEKFGRPQILKISQKELYTRQNEFWAQLLIVLWNEGHKDLYNAVKVKVETIDDDVEKVERIEDEVADPWITEFLEKFAIEDILICVYLNEVRFTDAFIRRRLETPLGIERDPEDKMGADSPYVAPEEAEAEAEAEEAEG